MLSWHPLIPCYILVLNPSYGVIMSVRRVPWVTSNHSRPMAKSHARRHLGRLHTRTRMGSDGDFVPSFAGGISPERFAANSLKRMITHAAARIVLKQMEGIAPQTGIGKSADPGAADVNAPHHHTDAERNVANIANVPIPNIAIANIAVANQKRK